MTKAKLYWNESGDRRAVYYHMSFKRMHENRDSEAGSHLTTMEHVTDWERDHLCRQIEDGRVPILR